MSRFINQLMLLCMAALAIVMLAFGLMLFMYLLLFGALVGVTLFAVNWLYRLFVIKKPLPPSSKSPSGRIIDADEWKRND